MTLEEARNRIGEMVVYTPFEGCSKDQLEIGYITSVNDKYVFVRYGSRQNSQATRPEDLR